MTEKSPKHHDIICVGKVTVDIIFYDLPKPPSIGEEVYTNRYSMDVGGGAAITAIGLSNLGLRSTLIASLGDNVLGTFILNSLKKHNIGLACLRRTQGLTNLSLEMSFPSDRATATALPAQQPIEITEPIIELIARSKHLHVVGPIRINEVELLKLAVSSGLTTSVDSNLMAEYEGKAIREALPSIDLLLPNGSEILGWNDQDDLNEIALHLGSKVRQGGSCIVKMGEQGAIASDNHAIVSMQAFPTHVLDTTGAGDAFNAGFLYGFLDNRSVLSCLALGNAMGSLKVQCLGGAAGMPNLDTLQQFMREQRATSE